MSSTKVLCVHPLWQLQAHDLHAQRRARLIAELCLNQAFCSDCALACVVGGGVEDCAISLSELHGRAIHNLPMGRDATFNLRCWWLISCTNSSIRAYHLPVPSRSGSISRVHPCLGIPPARCQRLPSAHRRHAWSPPAASQTSLSTHSHTFEPVHTFNRPAPSSDLVQTPQHSPSQLRRRPMAVAQPRRRMIQRHSVLSATSATDSTRNAKSCLIPCRSPRRGPISDRPC